MLPAERCTRDPAQSAAPGPPLLRRSFHECLARVARLLRRLLLGQSFLLPVLRPRNLHALVHDVDIGHDGRQCTADHKQNDPRRARAAALRTTAEPRSARSVPAQRKAAARETAEDEQQPGSRPVIKPRPAHRRRTIEGGAQREGKAQWRSAVVRALLSYSAGQRAVLRVCGLAQTFETAVIMAQRVERTRRAADRPVRVPAQDREHRRRERTHSGDGGARGGRSSWRAAQRRRALQSKADAFTDAERSCSAQCAVPLVTE